MTVLFNAWGGAADAVNAKNDAETQTSNAFQETIRDMKMSPPYSHKKLERLCGYNKQIVGHRLSWESKRARNINSWHASSDRETNEAAVEAALISGGHAEAIGTAACL